MIKVRLPSSEDNDDHSLACPSPFAPSPPCANTPTVSPDRTLPPRLGTGRLRRWSRQNRRERHEHGSELRYHRGRRLHEVDRNIRGGDRYGPFEATEELPLDVRMWGGVAQLVLATGDGAKPAARPSAGVAEIEKRVRHGAGMVWRECRIDWQAWGSRIGRQRLDQGCGKQGGCPCLSAVRRPGVS